MQAAALTEGEMTDYIDENNWTVAFFVNHKRKTF